MIMMVGDDGAGKSDDDDSNDYNDDGDDNGSIYLYSSCFTLTDIKGTIEAILSQSFRPMIDHYDNWGKVDDEQKNDFISEIGSFITNLNEALSSLQSGLELRSPDAKIIRAVEVKAHRTALPPEAIDHFEALLNEWCNEIEVGMNVCLYHTCLLVSLLACYK